MERDFLSRNCGILDSFVVLCAGRNTRIAYAEIGLVVGGVIWPTDRTLSGLIEGVVSQAIAACDGTPQSCFGLS